ncbi:MAG: RNA-binding S4 domain-containing protein [Ruminococcaceae bacterium]|nr:RNA-binding S4 domain-containing protein [Oscillospiraceae bacterium]
MNIKIDTEYIKLDQLLKFSGIAFSGAEAKDMILAGCVTVDNELCQMRGKKMYPGSVAVVELSDGKKEEIKVE